MTVGELMSSPARAVRPETSLKAAAAMMAAYSLSGLPVVDADGRPLGVVSEADILAKERAQRGRRTAKDDAVSVREAMTGPPITVDHDVSVDVARTLMAEHDVRRLPVIERDGRVVGVISRTDLVRVAAL